MTKHGPLHNCGKFKTLRNMSGWYSDVRQRNHELHVIIGQWQRELQFSLLCSRGGQVDQI